MVKISLLSDCHLGYKSGKKTNDEQVNIREQDGYNAFKECIDGIIEEKSDYLVIAGDLFHSPSPSVRTITEAKKQLERLNKVGIETYIITGNHDTSDINHDISASVIMDCKDMNIYSYQEPLVIKDLKDNVRLYLVSHQKAKEQDKTFDEIKLDDGYVNLLVTHGSCFDTNLNQILHSNLEPREVVIPEKVLDMNWDYILMGHIHTRGWVHSKDGLTDTANRKQFYGGSLLRRGFTDSEGKLGRGWTTFSINDKNIEIEMHSIKERPQFDIHFKFTDSVEELNQDIYDKMKSLSKYDMPIVRINIHGINDIDKKSIDLQRFREFTDDFLTFIVKYLEKDEVKDNTLDISYDLSNNDILNDFKNFWNYENENIDETIREETKSKSKEYIQKGIENITKKE